MATNALGSGKGVMLTRSGSAALVLRGIEAQDGSDLPVS